MDLEGARAEVKAIREALAADETSADKNLQEKARKVMDWALGLPGARQRFDELSALEADELKRTADSKGEAAAGTGEKETFDALGLAMEAADLLAAPPEIRELERKSRGVMDHAPGLDATERKKSLVYCTIELYRLRFTSRPHVSRYLSSRRRARRSALASKGKQDPKAAVAAIDRCHPGVQAAIARLDALRNQLALRTAPHSKAEQARALIRNVLAVAWVVAAVPLMFAASLLRIIHPPLRKFGIHNGKLPLDLYQIYTARVLLAILGIRVRFQGLSRIKRLREDGLGTLGMFSHASNLDPIIVSAGPLAFKWVGKRVLFRVPIFGWIMTLWGHIAIDRKNLQKAKAAINGTVVEKIRRWGRSIAISPEGTRSRQGRLTDFKKGPFHLAQTVKLPITPIYIEGAWRLNPPKGVLAYPGKVLVDYLPAEHGEGTVEDMLVRVRRKLLKRAVRQQQQEEEDRDGDLTDFSESRCDNALLLFGTLPFCFLWLLRMIFWGLFRI